MTPTARRAQQIETLDKLCKEFTAAWPHYPPLHLETSGLRPATIQEALIAALSALGVQQDEQEKLREAFDEGAKWVAQVDDPARSKYSMDRGFAAYLAEHQAGTVTPSTREPEQKKELLRATLQPQPAVEALTHATTTAPVCENTKRCREACEDVDGLNYCLKCGLWEGAR